MYIVVILLGTSVGATTSAEAFLNADTLKIVALGLIAFMFGTAAGVLFGKLMCVFSGGKINPLIGSAGVPQFLWQHVYPRRLVQNPILPTSSHACYGS